MATTLKEGMMYLYTPTHSWDDPTSTRNPVVVTVKKVGEHGSIVLYSKDWADANVGHGGFIGEGVGHWFVSNRPQDYMLGLFLPLMAD